ncbi:MAG: DHA2 family efflux MFS transporter permease subunit [Mycobacterium pseudokansasii]|uniref:Putative transport protein HsrA n=1 Tax=Mycobacterium pseudokansasii TaxID=2341080 RepID=A0A498QZT5_9MYCO|nr:DHA2 family efflux MFS transporter permease subunit [Mycobacterium pseudokansasii]MBY0387792.1 DHA2 family efflux MFS transporter permease subunit [Mycobacterium pseudokansasii]VBA31833.1 putative transport protein HsrA [Mycobacterium pseudokansasii]VBA33622.1 putative transport protein HsrA [Mycobacterium pseudokansasii]VBA55300.1 putative transport protein HsrA [Mycobacterium pseudokansasii]
MLSSAMDKARSAPADAALPTTATGQHSPGEHVYPDRLDARVFRVAGVCVLASVMTILDATIVSVAQRTFIAEFDSTQAVVGWTMTGYTLALATVIPLAGWAADRFGTKRLWMGSILAFTLGSLLCALAPNILALIAFRAVQGIGGGMLMPLGFTILTRVAGPKRLGRMMAVLGIPMLLGPIGGPILGGWLIGAFSWPWIFLVNLPIGLIAFSLAALMFPKDQPAPAESFDLVGVLLLAPGLATFLFGVSSIPGRGSVTDRYVAVPVIIGLTLVGLFGWHAWHRADHPLLDLRLFKNPVFAQANLTFVTFAVAYFGAALLLPSYLQQVLRQTPLQSGVHLIPNGLGAMLTMPFAGAFMDRRGPGKSVLVGLTLIAAGLGIFTFGVARQADYLPTLLAGLLVLGMGTGATMMPLSGAAVQALAPREIARGSALISVTQQVGGSIGTALMSMILTNQFNRSENIGAANKIAALQQQADRHGPLPQTAVDPSAIPQQALAPDFASRVLHDLSHAYTVVFVIAVVLVVSTLIPAAFLPKTPAGAARV